LKQNYKKRVFVEKQKSSSEIAKKLKQNKAKKIIFGFVKTSKNEAKQDAFRFISLGSKN
jgi:hypothetical protein